MTLSVDSILDQFRNQSDTTVVLGSSFEELAKIYFENDAQQQQSIDEVWHYEDWANARGRSGKDDGIDLVASLRNEDGFCAIQAKCYQEDHQLTASETSRFFSKATSNDFKRRILIDTTTREVSSWVQDCLNEKSPAGQRIGLKELRESSIDWNTVWQEEPKQRPKKTPRTHQLEALQAVKDGFESHDRGQLIMACGTGKTYTGLIVAEDLVGEGGSVLVLVPSLPLMSQTVREWANDANVSLRSYAVCSDRQVGRHRKSSVRKVDEDIVEINASDLVLPATTDAKTLAMSISEQSEECMTVVFATYQSLGVIEAAQRDHRLGTFNLILCDEAHRTTGQIKSDKESSNFVIVHDQKRIKGKRRLYMTATPRIYSESAHRKAEERGAVELASMADESRFGPLFFHRGFAWAIEEGLLTDYRVVVLAMSEEDISARLQRLLSQDNELTLPDATKMVGCYKALMKDSSKEETFAEDPNPCQRSLLFCNTIKRSKAMQSAFVDVVEDYRNWDTTPIKLMAGCSIEHVDGSTASKERERLLDWLDSDDEDSSGEGCRLLTNVRCLGEGVDVPALDAIVFYDARKSQIDVVQALGRVMRRSPGKKFGYVVLPIGVPAGKTPEEALSDNERYEVVWKTLNALRSHDETIEGMIAALQLGEDAGERLKIIYDRLGSAATVEQLSTKSKGGPPLPPPPPPPPPIEPVILPPDKQLTNAILPKLVEKCGVLNTWTDWAKDIAEIARHHVTRLKTISQLPEKRGIFEQFLNELRDDLNDSVTEEDAIEMLAQHLITKPVFDAMFGHDRFTSSNSVSQAMDKVVNSLESEHLEKERATLEGFYQSIRNRAAQVRTSHGKQELVRTLYEKFFQGAFGKLTERLGIVYTPVEVVDFILKSVDEILQDRFRKGIGSPEVNVLDPFTGTGTFITRLLDEETGLVSDDLLDEKYKEGIHANEIVPLAYYIAGVNIESVYHARRPDMDYIPFNRLCLADSFHSTEEQGGKLKELLPRNHYRLESQLKSPIEVIVANPPYSIGQKSGDDNAQNVHYQESDKRLVDTYVAKTDAGLVRSLYDTYIRAFRWASDRIKEHGVIGFVSNAGWLEIVGGNGIRKCFIEEFSDIYVLNLRGNQRTSGELSRREGGKIFGAGSRAPIAITILVKDPKYHGNGRIHYYDIGDYLTREEKLARLNELESIRGVNWEILEPDSYGDWINQRNTEFSHYIPVGDQEKSPMTNALFETYSFGCVSGRDVWIYNYSKRALRANIRKTIEFFNTERERFHKENPAGDPRNWARYNKRKINWTSEWLKDLKRNEDKVIDNSRFTIGMYRPFTKRNIYFDRHVITRIGKQTQFFPEKLAENRLICHVGKGAKTDFSCLMVDVVPDVNLISPTVCLPKFYSASHSSSENVNDLKYDTSTNDSGILSRDAISNSAMSYFQKHFPNKDITNEQIFYYTYGVFHSPQYCRLYQFNLSKELARVPIVDSYENFLEFSRIGKELGDLRGLSRWVRASGCAAFGGQHKP